jgi:uncharacterized protein YqeY
MTGNPSPAVRQVAANVSKVVSKLPDGAIKDALEVALAEKEWRPILKKCLKQRRELVEEFKLINRRIKQMERSQKEIDNFEDYGPKPKRRVDG